MSLPINLAPNWFLWEQNEDGEDIKPIATFIPEVLGVVEVYDSTGVENHVRLILHLRDDESAEFSMPLAAIETVDWYSRDRRCLLNPNYAKARQYIANIIRLGTVDKEPEQVQRLDRTGIHKVDDEVWYVAGDRAIARSPDTTLPPGVELAPLPFRLDIDPELSPEEAYRGMHELISLSPEIGRVLVAHVISGFTRAAFKEAGMNPCAVLVIVGKTGMLKSSYVPHMVQFYNRGDGIDKTTRFNSTSRFIEDALLEYSECTVVIDDLHTAESRAIKRTNENTAEEIIRRIGDDSGRGRKEGKASIQSKFLCNAVFIGEYTFGKESTVPRALVTQVTQPPNGAILDQYQRHKPLLVSTFYFLFLQWYVGNYNIVRDEIDARLTKLREATADSELHGRLRDTHFYLQTAYMLFLEFCRDSGFISVQDAQNGYRDFSDQLGQLVLEQQARIPPEQADTKKVKCLKQIRKLYQKGAIRVAASVAEFDFAKHDGLIYYDCLCLRRDKLEALIRKKLPGITVDSFIKELLAKDALKVVASKNSVQISSLNGARFYGILLDKLS